MIHLGPRRFDDWAVPLGNMTMRGLSLVSRFGLSIYIARKLNFEALGLFGLLAGIAGTAPAFFGFGISYFTNREILHLPRDEAYLLLRDRLALSVAVVATLWIVGVVFMASGAFARTPRLALGAVIVSLEFVAFDLHIALINFRRPIAANFLLFVRSALWVGPVIALGLVSTQFRTLDWLLGCWLGALVLSFLLLFVVIRDAPFRRLAVTPVDWRALFSNARRAPMMYGNDLAVTGQTYMDRFIVAQMLGVAVTGVYTLFFSVTQGLYVLVATAVTQLSMPKLVAAERSDKPDAWRSTMRDEAFRAIGLSALVGAAMLAVTCGLLPAIGFGLFAHDGLLLTLMTAAALFKPIADLADTGLYSLGLDRQVAVTNIAGVVLSVLIGVGCIAAFGLVGIGLSALLTQLGLVMGRMLLLHRHLQRANPG